MIPFDTTVQVAGVPAIAAPSPEQIEDGHEPEVEVAIPTGVALPFSSDGGQTQMIAPVALIRFSFDRETAVEFFKKGLEVAEKLPAKPKSSIQTASSLSEVEAAAQRLADITKRM